MYLGVQLDYGVKGHGYSRWWPRKSFECNIFVAIGAFHQNQVTYISGPEDILVGFSGQKVKVTAGEA